MLCPNDEIQEATAMDVFQRLSVDRSEFPWVGGEKLKECTGSGLIDSLVS
jgi:hypothetical protein